MGRQTHVTTLLIKRVDLARRAPSQAGKASLNREGTKHTKQAFGRRNLPVYLDSARCSARSAVHRSD
jgi:hypothetical protein